MFQCTSINQYDTQHKQKKRQNHMIISIDEEKAFDKIHDNINSW